MFYKSGCSVCLTSLSCHSVLTMCVLTLKYIKCVKVATDIQRHERTVAEGMISRTKSKLGKKELKVCLVKNCHILSDIGGVHCRQKATVIIGLDSVE